MDYRRTDRVGCLPRHYLIIASLGADRLRAQFCIAMGSISYPLYAIQDGVIGIMTTCFHSTASAGLPLPLAILAVIVACASFPAGWIDGNVRKALEAQLLQRDKLAVGVASKTRG